MSSEKGRRAVKLSHGISEGSNLKDKATAQAIQFPMPQTASGIIIAVDFGTTFSGVAWHNTASQKSRPISGWPQVSSSHKVPTVLHYDLNGKCHWGFDVPAKTSQRLEWFKLLLNEEPFTTKEELLDKLECHGLNGYPACNLDLAHLKTTVNGIPEGKRPVDLVTDYLSQIYQHTIKTLAEAYPVLKDEIDGSGRMTVKWNLTVPAIWKHEARELTKRAAISAGMKDVDLISEPEAAAINGLETLQEVPGSVKVGDVYLIVDCGGGTVDLISYKITAIEPSLKMKECTVGTGGICGSTLIDRTFEGMIRRKLGTELFGKMTDEDLQEMREDFTNNVKIKFNPLAFDEEHSDDSDGEHTLPCKLPGIPDNPEKHIKRGRITLSVTELHDVFAPTFATIKRLVQKQVDKAEAICKHAITGIILVGGFGSSLYLTRWLEQNIRSVSRNTITIIRPENQALAIVLGALSHGVRMRNLCDNSGSTPCEGSLIQSRKARYNYGISISEPFFYEHHPIEKMAIDMVTGMCICKGRMLWMIRKGEDMTEGIPISIKIQRRAPIADDPTAVPELLIFRDKIYYNDSENPPNNVESPSVHHLLTYETNLNGHEACLNFKRHPGPNGIEYWTIPAEISMSYTSASLKFECLVGGKVLL
ncbi:hypothetical protein DFH27DRAFT_656534 [Peziza echinospora]|nr:hypothetical protein DFH27DRAFT_656534 [Peziza echinospora]